MSDTTTPPTTANRLVAEALGTFLLVFGGRRHGAVRRRLRRTPRGNPLGVGFLGVALAFGLTVVAGAYAWGPISGGHFNPAVTLGLAAAGRFEWKNTIGYIIAQIIGGAVGTTLIVLIGLFGTDNWLANAQDGGFASNGYGTATSLARRLRPRRRDHRRDPLHGDLRPRDPRRRRTRRAARRRSRGLVIGLTLTLIHLASRSRSTTRR